jgi:hypothetical protein
MFNLSAETSINLRFAHIYRQFGTGRISGNLLGYPVGYRTTKNEKNKRNIKGVWMVERDANALRLPAALH